MADTILEVRNLKKYFPTSRGPLQAVDGISFDVKKGETLGLVGESGCGKTTAGRCILRLIEPTSGKVVFDGKNVPSLPKDELRELRKDMQIIFQDPYGSLNPRMTVGDIIGEPLHIHKLAKGAEKEKRVREILEKVGLNAYHARRFPHEFSGGQRQRIGIARALAVNPRLIVCDEPVSALDVSIQAQVINLLHHLQDEFGLTYGCIAHDLSVVKHISDRVAVMYLGKIVETAIADDIINRPMHPYTQSLISAIPIPDPEKARARQRIVLEGEVPSPLKVPSGCAFRTRCRFATEQCAKETPVLRELEPGHEVACFHPQMP